MSEKVEDLNVLGAKLIKAELMGDDDLVADLKIRLENARKLTEENKKSQTPHSQQKHENYNKNYSNKSQNRHHNYQSSNKRYEKEEEAKIFKRNFKHDEYDDLNYEDFGDSSNKKKRKESKFVAESKNNQISKEQSKAADKCNFCIENSQKHLTVSIGKQCYLCLPSTESLVEGHCLIVPMTHCSSSVTCDEEIWTEISDFKKALVNMFDKKRKECVFYELYSNENKYGHMVIECVPLDMNVSNLAPIYFKKAILESESEWSTNKKIVDLKEKTVRDMIPKNMPYFTVGFGLDNGYAHVIEKSEAYPNHFAKEVLGGILDLDPLEWMRPKQENFTNQSKKVIEFLKWWKPFDFNKN